MTGPIVDVCATPYDAECWRAYLTGFATDAPDYLRAFGGRLARTAGLDPRHIAALVTTDTTAAIELLAEGLAVDIDEHASMLRAAGVERQVMHSCTFATPDGGSVNDRLAARAAQHPELLEAWCSVDLATPDEAMLEMDRCVRELGMRGVTLTPFWSRSDPESRGAHEVYEHAETLDVPVWIHCSANLAADRPMGSVTPAHLDRIACAHPSLVLIAGHGGWPWVLEMVAVALRHRNVYIETSAHRPADMASAGSGWEPLLFHARGPLRGRVLFGSLGWAQGSTLTEVADEVWNLPIPEEARRAWLHDNAAGLLQVPQPTPAGAVR